MTQPSTVVPAPGDPPPVMELGGVTRRFGDLEVLHPTDLVVMPGDYLAITGPSGSGKSTLLHLLGLLDTPTSGTYRFDGTDTGALDDIERAAVRGRGIGFVFQAFHLLAARTALENVELGMLYQRLPRSERRRRALAALERVELSHRLAALPTTLSGGERQRVAIARAIAGEARVLLADEPTGNLDTATGDRILDLFDSLHRSGLTIVVITHDDRVAARAFARCRLQDGVLSPRAPQTAALL
jgi:putative ABC transport system ATP-binding protein